MQWPEEDHEGDGDNDRFDRLEKMIQRLIKAGSGGRKRKAAGSSGAGSSRGDRAGTAGSGEEDDARSE